VSAAPETPPPLDEETIAAVQRRIGIPVRRSVRMQNEVCSVDSFRQFAQGYGVRAVIVMGGVAGPAAVCLLRGQVAPR
jgi:hypothetical protein